MMVNSLKPRLVTGNLKKKGFREDERHDHIWYVLYIDGKQTNIRTKVSHNSNDLGISLIKKMAEQLKIDTDTFVDLVTCKIDGQEYRTILERKKIL